MGWVGKDGERERMGVQIKTMNERRRRGEWG